MLKLSAAFLESWSRANCDHREQNEVLGSSVEQLDSQPPPKARGGETGILVFCAGLAFVVRSIARSSCGGAMTRAGRVRMVSSCGVVLVASSIT